MSYSDSDLTQDQISTLMHLPWRKSRFSSNSQHLGIEELPYPIFQLIKAKATIDKPLLIAHYFYRITDAGWCVRWQSMHGSSLRPPNIRPLAQA